ncbi:hypothetical protein SEVIR_5G076301v4 [Setaria viridis]|nr:uncharacterized protein LOC117857691 isoform X1 [Setaria viridis]
MTDAILVWSGKLFTNLIINGFSWRSSTVSHDRGSDLKAHAGWSTADEQLNKQQTYKVQSFSSKQQWQTLILRFAICFQQFDSEYTGSKVLGAGSQHCHPPGIRSHETRVTGGSHKWRKKTATHLSPCASLNYLDADIWTQAEIIVKVYISLSHPTCPLILIPSGWLFIHSSLLSRSHLINPGEKQSKLERIWITEQLILSGATVQSRVARAAS